MPRCNGIFQPDGGKKGLFYFQGMLSAKLRKERGSHARKASICQKKQGGIQPPTAGPGQGNCWGEMVSRQLTLSAAFIIASL